MATGVLRFTEPEGNVKVCPWVPLDREQYVNTVSTAFRQILSHMEARDVLKSRDT